MAAANQSGKGDGRAERLACQFSLIRYVPDAVKNEFVNIGVMLREAARPEAAQVRFTKDWARVRCVRFMNHHSRIVVSGTYQHHQGR